MDEIQPVFTKNIYTYHSATLLHRLAADGSVSTLERRFNELTPDIVNNTKCWFEYENGSKYTEVRQKHLATIRPHLPPSYI